MGDSNTSTEEPLFALPKTRLQVFPSELHRRNEDGTMLLRLPLASIRSAEFHQPFDPACLLFFGIGIGVLAIGWFVSMYNWLSCLLYVAGIIGVAFGILGRRKDEIVLGTDRGTLKFACPEQADEVQCFVISLQELVANHSPTKPSSG